MFLSLRVTRVNPGLFYGTVQDQDRFLEILPIRPDTQHPDTFLTTLKKERVEGTLPNYSGFSKIPLSEQGKAQ